MKTLNKIKPALIIYIVCLIFFCLPQGVMAQRFSHGGGGGGARGGGGGGAMRGGGGGFRGPGGGTRPVQVMPRGGSINGGARNFGNHDFHGGGYHSGPVVGFHHGENVFHHGYGSHPYFYHPYHPYAWGPYWHPFGYFAAGLTADAILLSLNGGNYYYDNGVYYQPYGSGYSVVAPPVGAVVSYLPDGYETVQTADGYYFYFGGTFYVGEGSSYRVVPAPPGAIVTQIPEGATQQVINGESYLLYNNTYYEPISQNGQDAYQVVQVN